MTSEPPVEKADVRDAATAVTEGLGILVDVREDWEWRRGHADGARHIPLTELPAHLEELRGETPVYLICATGNRSGRAAAYLRQHGVDRPINVRGGTVAWQRAGLPISDRP